MFDTNNILKISRRTISGRFFLALFFLLSFALSGEAAYGGVTCFEDISAPLSSRFVKTYADCNIFLTKIQ
jgi:hypothetical protein